MTALRPRASVVTPTYNKAALLDLTLASYVHQTHRDFEVVVVDDGSTDQTRDVVERYRKSLDLKYVYQSNTGRAAARNAGIRQATGELLIFADDDRIAVPGFIAAHVSHYSGPEDKTLVVGAQKALLSWFDGSQETRQRVTLLLQEHPELEAVLARGEKVRLIGAEDIQERLEEVLGKFGLPEPWWETSSSTFLEFDGDINRFGLCWAFCTTGNMSVMRRRVLEVGMFDEAFSNWGIEDTEFSFRLCKAGARIAISQEALSYHQLHPRGQGALASWYRNLDRFWRKFESIEVALFYLYTQCELTSAQVNEIVDDCQALEREGRLALVRELQRSYRAAFDVALRESQEVADRQSAS
jgi:glycosyltransferase involved in cell wall biosynthesis